MPGLGWVGQALWEVPEVVRGGGQGSSWSRVSNEGQPEAGAGGGEGGGEGEEGIKSSHCAAGRWGLRLAGRAVWGPEPGQEGRGWAGRSPLWPFQREAPGGVWGTGRDSPGMSQHGNASHPSVYKASPVCKLPEPH